jgi:hypothetical protein
MRSVAPAAGWRAATRRSVVVLVAAALGAVSCGNDPPTSPTPAPRGVLGQWSGSVSDREVGAGQLRMEIIGSEAVPTGTFSLALANGARVTGLVIGRTNEHPTIVLTFLISEASRDCPGAPGFAYRARLVLTDNRLTGTYGPELGCAVLSSGSLELTR